MTGVTPIRDGHFGFDPLLFPDVRRAPAEAATLLGLGSLPERIDIPVWCYLIETPGGPGLVDAGSGGLLGGTYGTLRKTLAEQGVAPKDICRIWLTHLHGDHCGGLVTPRGAPEFPNARIALPDGEAGYWLDSTLSGIPAVIAEDAKMALAPYTGSIDRIAHGAEVDGALALPASGHTPGHTAWLFGDHAALAAGDIFHVPAFQLHHPEWFTDWDADPDAAAETRSSPVPSPTG